ETGIFYVTPCSAKMTAVNEPVAEKQSVVNGIINMKDLYNRVMQRISKQTETDTSKYRQWLSREGILWSLPRGEVSALKNKGMAIDGINNVVKFLERLENNEVPGLDFVEMKSCNQGCAGGILLSGNRYLTVERLQKRARMYHECNKSEPERLIKYHVKEKLVAKKIIPDYAFSLDENRAKALEKMQKADKILCQLPGIDCGACGAPNCHALAEDIVQGRGKLSSCIFLQNKYVKLQKMAPEKAWKNQEKIWGLKRFDADCNKKGGRNEGF
ncbi:MAG TPA: (Fe-S)-binding protein, partial [Prolixibacteraceae bacterium]|nr:(Fe-S)-binding protein [Prolixibacteraceae bacterium]